jgi:hypothetical protein
VKLVVGVWVLQASPAVTTSRDVSPYLTVRSGKVNSSQVTVSGGM